MSGEFDFSLLDEMTEIGNDFYIRHKNNRQITFNERANQVKYFNIDAPPVEVSLTIVAVSIKWIILYLYYIYPKFTFCIFFCSHLYLLRSFYKRLS